MLMDKVNCSCLYLRPYGQQSRKKIGVRLGVTSLCLVSVFLNVGFSHRLSPSIPHSFHCFIKKNVTGAIFFLWLLAGLPGFSSHETSLHLAFQ